MYKRQPYLNSTKDRGWSFGNQGNPEFFHFRDQLVVKGGKVLDMGIGHARSSMFFALHDMDVEGIDLSPEVVDDITATAEETGLPISAREGDVSEIVFPPNSYDVVLMDFTFVHFDSREKALTTMNNALAALRRGGHMWVRAVGKEDELYDHMSSVPPMYLNVPESPDVKWQMCGCSGQPLIEPHLFLGQTDLVQFAAINHMNILLSNSMPMRGRPNFMYGEDFRTCLLYTSRCV